MAVICHRSHSSASWRRCAGRQHLGRIRDRLHDPRRTPLSPDAKTVPPVNASGAAFLSMASALRDRQRLLAAGRRVLAQPHDVVDRGRGDGVDLGRAAPAWRRPARAHAPDAVLNGMKEADLLGVERMVVRPMVEPGRAVHVCRPRSRTAPATPIIAANEPGKRSARCVQVLGGAALYFERGALGAALDFERLTLDRIQFDALSRRHLDLKARRGWRRSAVLRVFSQENAQGAAAILLEEVAHRELRAETMSSGLALAGTPPQRYPQPARQRLQPLRIKHP